MCPPVLNTAEGGRGGAPPQGREADSRGCNPISAKIGCKVLKEVAKSLSTRVQTRKERPMPLQEITTQYAQLRQELPPESAHLARECQAFQRARVIESAEDLLYLVLLYSSAGLSVREIAGVCAGSGHPLSDEAVRQRLAACPQWVEALVGKLLPGSPLPPRAEG